MIQYLPCDECGCETANEVIKQKRRVEWCEVNQEQLTMEDYEPTIIRAKCSKCSEILVDREVDLRLY